MRQPIAIRRITCSLVAIALLGMQSVPAATPIDTSRLNEITVEGNREVVKDNMRHFVEHVTRPDFLDRSLARWLQPICPASIGLPREQGEYVLARVSTIAVDAKAPLATDAGCRPNLFIVFTNDPRDYLQKLLHQFPYVFTNGGRTSMVPGVDVASPRAVNALLDSQAPVRVWYNTAESAQGGHPDILTTAQVSNGTQLLGVERQRIGSPRLWFGGVQGFDDVFVIVDTTKTQGLALAPIVDYSAMVGLMELQPDAKVAGAPSILAAFSGNPQHPTHLTSWDTAFLAGLYDTEQFSRGQRELIVDRMIAKVAP